MISSGLATGARIFSISSARIVRSAALVEPLELLRGDRLADAVRRLGAEVGGDQRLLDLVERRGVERGAAGQAGEIVGDPFGGLAESRRAGGRANSCPDRRQVIAVAAGDPRRRRFRRARRRRCATGAKLSVWPVPSPSISTGCGRPDQAVEPARAPRRSGLAQPGGARLDQLARDLRHARGGRVGPRREGEDVRRRRRRNRRAVAGCSAPFPQFRSESRR